MIVSYMLAVVLEASTPESALVTITVVGDDHYTRAHTISISSLGPEQAGWTATRVWDGGAQSLTSVECPVLGDAVRTFGELPPIPIKPPSAMVARGETLPIAPIMLDGFGTILSFETTTRDGSPAQIQIDGGNDYRLWGHRTVAALIGCWGPLYP